VRLKGQSMLLMLSMSCWKWTCAHSCDGILQGCQASRFGLGLEANFQWHRTPRPLVFGLSLKLNSELTTVWCYTKYSVIDMCHLILMTSALASTSIFRPRPCPRPRTTRPWRRGLGLGVALDLVFLASLTSLAYYEWKCNNFTLLTLDNMPVSTSCTWSWQ